MARNKINKTRKAVDRELIRQGQNVEGRKIAQVSLGKLIRQYGPTVAGGMVLLYFTVGNAAEPPQQEPSLIEYKNERIEYNPFSPDTLTTDSIYLLQL